MMQVSPLLKLGDTGITETDAALVSCDFWGLQNEVPELSEELAELVPAE